MPPRTTSPTIAIVDDDIAVGRSLSKLLMLMGFRAQFHSSGAEFIFSLGTLLPDVALIDAQMPGTDGIQVMDCITRMGLNLPMILATGSHDERVWDAAEARGARSTLLKPYCIDDLCIKINQVLGCPGFVPKKCPWPCPAIGRGVWNCAFAGFPKQARDYLNAHRGPRSPEELTTLASYGQPQSNLRATSLKVEVV